MTGVSFEVFVIILLVLANGVLAMAEIAVVSARKARLQQQANEGIKNAQKALDLANRPSDFLSTVQVGITLIGTLAGAFGGATIAEQLAQILKQYPVVGPYGELIGITVVVLAISYLSLILGELVPKNLALTNPERVAAILAPSMAALSRFASPIVRFLSWSTELVIRILPLSKAREAPASEAEIMVLLAEGARHGTVHETEQEMVEGVFRLGDRSVKELMQPSIRVEWIDADAAAEEIRRTITSSVHSRFPVARGSLDHLIGVVHVRDLLAQVVEGGVLDVTACLRPPLFVPETKPALEVLDLFQESGFQLVLVIDEHGTTQGILTLTDLFQAVVGDLHSAGEAPRPTAVQRVDGSWLVDGMLHIDDFKERLDIPSLPSDDDGGFTTVGGFAMMMLGKVPAVTDRFEAFGWIFEVVDMDGNRVDKLLVRRIATPLEN
jgi:putative hemolysin